MTHNEFERFIKSLPISYYCGKKVEVVVAEGSSSFFDPMNTTIHISESMMNAAGLVDEESLRCIVYHEVSHALLTPRDWSMLKIENVFEDERIETLMHDFYINVDFKEFVKRINNFQNNAPQNAFDLYYQIVRYRVGPQQFVKRVEELIKKHANVSSAVSIWCTDLQDDIRELYRDIEQYFNQKANEQSVQTIENKADDTSNCTQACANENDSENIDGQDITQQVDIKALIESVVNKYDDANLAASLDKILLQHRNINKSNGSAINSYSGVFDPRSVVRQDYKWFAQKNRNGHVKQFSKLKLNLFIDRSGSFSRNEHAVNCLIKALIEFEKKNSDFSFDVIKCGIGQEIAKKNDRAVICYDGTRITSEIFSQYKKVQEANADNVNIVLYDGDCTCCGAKRDAVNLRAFDNNRTICILDQENEKYANMYLTHAKVIISSKYLEELTKNVFIALQTLLR